MKKNKSDVILKSAEEKTKNLQRFFAEDGSLNELRKSMESGCRSEDAFCKELTNYKSELERICKNATSDEDGLVTLFNNSLMIKDDDLNDISLEIDNIKSVNKADYEDVIDDIKERFKDKIKKFEEQCNDKIDKTKGILKEQLDDRFKKCIEGINDKLVNADFMMIIDKVAKLHEDNDSMLPPDVDEFLKTHPIKRSWVYHFFHKRLNLKNELDEVVKDYKGEATRSLKRQARKKAKSFSDIFCSIVQDVRGRLDSEIDKSSNYHNCRKNDYENVVKRIDELNDEIKTIVGHNGIIG